MPKAPIMATRGSSVTIQKPGESKIELSATAKRAGAIWMNRISSRSVSTPVRTPAAITTASPVTSRANGRVAAVA